MIQWLHKDREHELLKYKVLDTHTNAKPWHLFTVIVDVYLYPHYMQNICDLFFLKKQTGLLGKAVDRVMLCLCVIFLVNIS